MIPEALLAACLLGAVCTDMRWRRIPNRLVACGIGLAFAAHAIVLGWGSIPLAGPVWWAPLTGLATGLGVLLPLYLLRATGAGDVKLMAMVGAFVGAPAVVTVTLYTFLAGGVLAIGFMLGRGVAAQAFSNLRFMLTHWAVRATTGQGVRLEPLENTAARLPYALAIAIGTGAALIWPLGT